MRQIGVATPGQGASAYTGDDAGAFTGHRAEGRVTVQGNGLASEAVLVAMWDAFHRAGGPLDARLLAALEAGYAEGGQSIGVMSAALVTAGPEGWPVDVDLRVDYASGAAIAELRRAFDARVARQLLFRARQLAADDPAGAQTLIEEALLLAPDWDRVWLNAGWLADEAGQAAAARRRFCRFRTLNPNWAERLSDRIDFSACE